MDNTFINDIEDLLRNTNEPQWQTATGISSKLNRPNYGPNEVETLLISLYKSNPDASIRYSSLPSRTSLQVLWGHVDRVKNRTLVDIFKEDEASTANYLADITNKRNVFLSHSFKDTAAVFALAKDLIQYELYPWIAEVDIDYRAHINEEVIAAIRSLPNFGIYLSRNVLESTWSAKEFEFAIRNKRKLFAFVSADEPEIIDLIENNNPKNQTNIHSLLKRIFDNSEFSEQMSFFCIPGKRNFHSEMNRIKPLSLIAESLI